MTALRRSFAYSVADSYLALPLQIAGTMIISRLLTPAETGVFAVAAVFAAFASTFRDFGVAEYLIQEKELSAEKIRAALTVNLAVSWAMAALLFFAAPFAAEFYRTAGVAEVMRVQAFNFILIPFGAVTMAHFRRQLDFRPIFVASLLANLTTFAVATVCALQGFGYMSLAWSSLAGVTVTVAASLWFRPPDFPKWPGLRGIGRVLHFGKFASGIYLFGQLGRGAPEMIIGRAQDMVGVALFSRASGLVEIFNRTVLRTVMPVCLPYFARNSREHGSVKAGYLKSMACLTAIGWPFLAFVGIVAYAAVRIVYGPQWMASVPLARILCAVGAIELVHHLAKEAMIAGGDVRRSNQLQIGQQAARIAGLLAVIPFGLSGACWGLLVAAIVGALYAQWHLARGIGLKVREVLASCLPSAGIAVLAVAPAALWASVEGVAEDNFLPVAFVGGAITAALWLAALRLLRHPLWHELSAMLQKTKGRRERARALAGDSTNDSTNDPAGELAGNQSASRQSCDALSRHYAGATVQFDGTIGVRDNSEIHHVRIGGAPTREAAVKCCLIPHTQLPDSVAAREQFEALERVSIAFSHTDLRFRVPIPLLLMPEIGAYAMSWIRGESLADRMRSPSAAAAAPAWFEMAGEWLGHFHRTGPRRRQRFSPAPRLQALDKICAAPLPHRAFSRAAECLRRTAPGLEGQGVAVSWLHGDCKSDNFFLRDRNVYGIDISLKHENPVEYDLVQFLNNLDLLLASPHHRHLRGQQSRLEAAFLRGYLATGASISADCLNWLQLSFALSLWHGMHEQRHLSPTLLSSLRLRLRCWLLDRMFARLVRRLTWRLDATAGTYTVATAVQFPTESRAS